MVDRRDENLDIIENGRWPISNASSPDAFIARWVCVQRESPLEQLLPGHGHVSRITGTLSTISVPEKIFIKREINISMTSNRI